MKPRFTFQGAGPNATQLIRYDGERRTDAVVIPNDTVREVGEALIDLADAQAALSKYFRGES